MSLSLRRKVTTWLVAASLILLLVGPAFVTPVLADCATASSTNCATGD